MKNGIKTVKIRCPKTKNYAIYRQDYYKNLEECILDAKNIYSKRYFCHNMQKYLLGIELHVPGGVIFLVFLFQ